jgi:hypothetical protein
MMNTYQLELFTRVKTHLLTQNAKSLSAGGACKYRGYEGRSCALGVLISDEAYRVDFEGEGLTKNNDVEEALEESGVLFNKGVFTMLHHLQSIHDESEPDKWAAKLDALEVDLNI